MYMLCNVTFYKSCISFSGTIIIKYGIITFCDDGKEDNGDVNDNDNGYKTNRYD